MHLKIEKSNNIKEKFLLFPIISILAIFLIKFFYFLRIIKIFPLNAAGDYAHRMLQLFFLSEYGFHSIIPHCFEGFVLLKYYPPLWHFFTLPIYWLVGNIQLSTFISIVLIYILTFLVFFVFGKYLGLSKIKRIAFFAFFFMNPLAIDYVMNIGRIAEFFAWMIFVPFAFLILYYKNKPLDKKFFLLFISLFSLIIIAHPYIVIPSSILIFSLFLVQNSREKIKIALSVIASLIITSFWWIPFLDVSNTATKMALQNEFLTLGSIISFNTISIILLFLALYFYQKQKINKKDWIFFSPILLLALVILSRAIVLIPIINKVSPSAYTFLFLFIALFLFFKTKSFNKNTKKIVIISLLLLPFLCGGLVFLQSKIINYTPSEEAIVNLLPFIEEKFVILDSSEMLPIIPLTNLAIINSNKETLICITALGADNKSYMDAFKQANYNLKNNNCENLISFFNNFEIKEIIAYGEDCNILKSCELYKAKDSQNACLMKID